MRNNNFIKIKIKIQIDFKIKMKLIKKINKNNYFSPNTNQLSS
jgi:hypothetical protein